jgi:hypothetical protein
MQRKNSRKRHPKEIPAPNPAKTENAAALTLESINRAFEERVGAGRLVFGDDYDDLIISGQVESRNLAHQTDNPSGQTADCVVLGELYWRFVQGTLDWAYNRHHRNREPPREDKKNRVYRTTPVTAADIAVMLHAAIQFAETFWLPDELERQGAVMKNQHLFSRVRKLEPKNIILTMELARFLFDHPYDLPSFLEPNTALDARPYDVLVWFHFALYPSLKDSFLAGVFPGIQDLPPTVLGIAPANPATNHTPERPKSIPATSKGWKPPKNYTGAKSADVPRSTLEGWEQEDAALGGELEGKVKKDPSTRERYYPNCWLNKRKENYKPRKRLP